MFQARVKGTRACCTHFLGRFLTPIARSGSVSSLTEIMGMYAAIPRTERYMMLDAFPTCDGARASGQLLVSASDRHTKKYLFHSSAASCQHFFSCEQRSQVAIPFCMPSHRLVLVHNKLRRVVPGVHKRDQHAPRGKKQYAQNLITLQNAHEQTARRHGNQSGVRNS